MNETLTSILDKTCEYKIINPMIIHILAPEDFWISGPICGVYTLYTLQSAPWISATSETLEEAINLFINGIYAGISKKSWEYGIYTVDEIKDVMSGKPIVRLVMSSVLEDFRIKK